MLLEAFQIGSSFPLMNSAFIQACPGNLKILIIYDRHLEIRQPFRKTRSKAPLFSQL